MKHTENSQPGPDQIEPEGPMPSALIVTLNLVFLFYTNLMVRLLISPLFLTIQEDLAITKAAAGQFYLFLYLFLFLQPGILAIFPTMGYLFLEGFGPPESRVQSTMISIIIPFAFLFGNGVFPTLLTWLADRGLFSQGFIAYGIILAVSPVVYYLVLGSRKESGSSSYS